VELTKFLKLVVEKGASDGFASVGSAPVFKVNGDLLAESTDTLSAEDVRALIQASMTAKQFEDYATHRDANYAIEHPGLGRFRASAYVQREQPALVVRPIYHDIPTFEQLGLPSQLKDLSLLKQGLVMIVGATGTGKSSTLAAMVDYRKRIDEITSSLSKIRSSLCIVTSSQSSVSARSVLIPSLLRWP